MNKKIIGAIVALIAVGIFIVLSTGSKDGPNSNKGIVAAITSNGGAVSSVEGSRSAGRSSSPSTPKLDTGNYKRSEEYKNNDYFNQMQETILNDLKVVFPDAEKLSAEGETEVVYIEALHSLLDEYRLIVKSGYPIGVNVEVTNALLGDNPKKVALLDQEHSRINEDGELVDQWDTPYFFHANSLVDIDIRSAGEDQKLYTEDDVISKSSDL